MSETSTAKTARARRIRHRGRDSQILIYLGKQFRFFINESDWKVLPMAAVIAALVSMVIRKRFFINMEGSLIGAFALSCMAIWNGCFNSIQSICRERAIVKREHRSGLHISAYITAHMIYQFLLCAAQTGLSIYVMTVVGVQFPQQGFMTPWMTVDIGITMLLATYAADMLSLFISSISHTTTGAMTVMPFVLIFQLVFSGGIIPLPEWSQSLSSFTISNYSICAVAAQSGYNELPMVTAWNTVDGMREEKVEINLTIGQILDWTSSPAVTQWRDQALPVNEVLDAPVVPGTLTLGDVIDMAQQNEWLNENRDKTIHIETTVGELLELFGEERVKTLIQTRTAASSRNPKYERTRTNVIDNWLMLGVFIVVLALMSTISLELIDRDRR